VTRRAGGWILALVVIGAMGGSGWFALRRALHREDAVIVLLVSADDSIPTRQAVQKGARLALEHAGHRAGKYRLTLQERDPGVIYDMPGPVAAWVGPGDAILARGHQQGRPFSISVFDTHPAEPQDWYPMTPGWSQQGLAAGRWAKKTGASRVFLVRDSNSARSKAIAAAFEKAAAAQGLILTGSADATMENAGKILVSEADLVFFSGEEAPYGLTTRLFKSLREKGFVGRLATGEADPQVSFLATRPDLVDGTYLVSPFAPGPPELAARMKFVQGPHITAGYVAMKAVLETIDHANSIKDEDLHRAWEARSLPLRPCALYVARNGVFEFVETLP
jgi:hypothetical protein